MEPIIDSPAQRRASLKPENVVAIVDSREQRPLSLDPLQMVTATLATGDYALKSAPDACRIERKSLSDLLGCVGRERERFEREVDRLLAFPVRILLIESTWSEIDTGQWRGKITSSQVIGSLLGWQAKGLSVHMAGSHRRAGQHASRLLFTVARRRWRELQAMESEQRFYNNLEKQ